MENAITAVVGGSVVLLGVICGIFFATITAEEK